MKVALVANRLASPHPTGVDRYHRELVGQLARRDDLSCTTLSTSEREEPTWVPAGVRAAHVPGPRKLVHLAWGTLGRPRVDRYADGPDLVHVTVPAFPVPSRAPVVYTLHDLMTHQHPEWFGRIHRWGADRAFADVVARAAAVITNSRSTAEAATAVLGVDPARITAIPLGVSAPFFAPPDPQLVDGIARRFGVTAGAFALYVGQVDVRKNLPVVLRAMAQLRQPLPLVVAGGRGAGSAEVEATIDALGLAERVHLAGFVADAELPALLRAARVLVHPSQFEGFGLTVLEAMAVGTPTIVADTGALPDTAGGAALVVAADDPAAWAAALDSLDESTRSDLSARGRAHAARFTWERTAAATVEVYRSVLAQP